VIDRADDRVRVLVIAGIVTLVLIGLVIVVVADPARTALIGWILRDPAQSRSRAVTVSIALAAAVILPVLGAAGYLWRFGVRVVRERRFPPAGTLLIADTLVIEGIEAQRRGRMLQAVAIGLAATSLVFTILFWRLIVLTNPAR
jgi:hypothetical protein